MPKLKVFSGNDLIKLFLENGFSYIRTKGSHSIVQKQLIDTTITIPIPLHKELKIGTLSSIIRQSKLPRDLFETN